MREGYLTGPESFLIEDAKKFRGFGTEDLDELASGTVMHLSAL